MATVDSGTETLFSDESPSCGSPEDTDATLEDATVNHSTVVGPPNIQPYSGVLEKGKVVIRPIAFKPAAMTPAPRFGLAGERYGSTPILTRPGSRLTLYGSNNDLHHNGVGMNYSLDRKLRSCPSAASSPPTGMSSLISLPHKLLGNYDSLESVRKSPIENGIINKSSYRLSCTGGGSLLDLTPSPSDSGVSELEAALRDRDSELAYLRQTMEHNEQVIIRVYQEKERVWKSELRRLKTVHESRLRASAQKAAKLEQMLMMQTYQLQQEKRRLAGDLLKANALVEKQKKELEEVKGRLEETEWGLCQKTGEMALMKTQLKECQAENTSKGHELLQLRKDYREVRDTLSEQDSLVHQLESTVADRDKEIEELRKQLRSLEVKVQEPEAETLRTEIKQLRDELSDLSIREYSGVEAGRTESISRHKHRGCCPQLEKLQMEFEEKRKGFEKERLVWVQEKEKVLRYQRQLQMNYVEMYRRTRALEAEVESLTIELELDKTGMKGQNEMNHTIEL